MCFQHAITHSKMYSDLPNPSWFVLYCRLKLYLAPCLDLLGAGQFGTAHSLTAIPIQTQPKIFVPADSRRTALHRLWLVTVRASQKSPDADVRRTNIASTRRLMHTRDNYPLLTSCQAVVETKNYDVWRTTGAALELWEPG